MKNWLVSQFVICIVLGSNAQFSPEQQKQIDSNNRIISNRQTNDTNIVNSLIDKGSVYYLQFPDSAFELCNEALKLSESINYESGIYLSYWWLAYLLNQKGQIPEAIEYYHKCVTYEKSKKDTSDVADLLNNIAAIYQGQDDLDKALEYNLESLELRKKINDSTGIAQSLSNIGLNYKLLNNIDLALDYYLRSLDIRRRINDKQGIAQTLNNIGKVYFNKAKESSKYEKQDSLYNLTFQCYNESLFLKKELKDRKGISTSHNNLGALFIAMKNYSEAERHLLEGLNTAIELGNPRWISDNSENLYIVYKELKQYQKSLSMFELHIQMRDSIKNEETQKAAIRQQTKYEFEKAQLVAEQQRNEELRIMNEELNRRNNLQYSLIFLGVIVLFSLLFILGKFSISPLFAEGLIFFAFLIFFEFLLVLSDPFIESITGGEPIYKLLANASLAGAIFPAHAFFERTLKKRIVKS